jgi:glutamyl-tRNA synthetase
MGESGPKLTQANSGYKIRRMSSKPPVRVRFAPSPTGLLHIGGLRSALFNWLWARHTGGTFVLRIEDTDRQRLVEGALEQILAAHDALGITPDEGPAQGGNYSPYIQSERKEQGIYQKYTDELVKTGGLYRCWCSPERLAKLREEAQVKGIAFKYDRHCLIPENHKTEADPHVLRFRIPDEPETIGWEDAVRGHLEFKTADLDDFVAIKADGFPTYHFANVVDDYLMNITHVLRADEWIPSTPKHLLLYRAFGWEPPVFAHLPAVQGPTGGKKLSKRDGARSVQEYIEEGYLPEALRSFLATLGWNDGTTQEIYTTPELIERFTLDRIQKSPARFDLERLTWVNGKMIRELWQSNPDELLARCEPFWPASAHSFDAGYKQDVLGLVQDRLTKLSDLPELTDFFFTDPKTDPVLLAKNFDTDTASRALEVLFEQLKSLPGTNWTEEVLEQTIRPLTDQLGLKTGHFFGLIRTAVTGRVAAPGLFETIAVLGPSTTLRRLESACAQLKD